MRFVCVSDTHGAHNKMMHDIPDGDMLLIAGDFSNWGKMEEVCSFNEWLGTLPHKYKVCIAGNHDLNFDSFFAPAELGVEFYEGLLTNVTHYLNQSGCEIEGVKIWGEPRTPAFMDWAFNIPRPRMGEYVWDKVPEDTQILLTHGPPLGYGCSIPEHHIKFGNIRRAVGCIEQSRLIQDLPDLRAVVCGHIHSGYGIHKVEEKDTYVFNASICNEHLEPVNKPLVFDI